MDTIRLQNNGTLSSDGSLVELLRMKLVLDEEVTLRSFFSLLRRYPLAQKLVPGLSSALAEAEACTPSGCRYPGLQGICLNKRIELRGFPGEPSVDVYLAIETIGNELPELRFFRLQDMLDTPLRLGCAQHVLLGEATATLNAETSFTLFELLEGLGWELSFQGGSLACKLKE